QLLLQVALVEASPNAAAGAVDEKGNLRLLGLEKFGELVAGVCRGEIQGDGLDHHTGQGGGERLEPVSPPGDEPEALDFREDVPHLPGKLLAKPRGGAGDDGGFHDFWLLSFFLPQSMPRMVARNKMVAVSTEKKSEAGSARKMAKTLSSKKWGRM